jgi:hypothetical protein
VEKDLVTVARRVQAKLAARVFAGSSVEAWPGYPTYVKRPESILVPGLNLSDFKADLERGQGNELRSINGKPPKFHAVHSSSALAVNTLGVFRRSPRTLALADRTAFTSLEFEYPCPTGAGQGIANLDALAQTAGGTDAVESKLCEFLRSTVASFSPKYDAVVASVADSAWAVFFEELKQKPRLFRYLDAAQLVKHYLGLRSTFPKGDLRLVYLFWEPTNATRYDAYRVHAEEVVAVATRFARSNMSVVPLRYAELWAAMGNSHPTHVGHLQRRYSFAV